MKNKTELTSLPNCENIENPPFFNLKERMKRTYPAIYKTLDLNYPVIDGSFIDIYQEFKNAFLNYYFNIYLNYNKDNDLYAPFIVYKGKHYKVDIVCEFDLTAQMACIEKCFEIIDELGLHLKSSTFFDKFEDFHAERELFHLQNGTEFEAKEIYNYFKPYIDLSKLDCEKI